MLIHRIRALATLAVLALAVAPSWAQTDLSRVLVGRWEGQVELQGGTLPRVLIIISAREQGGQWSVEAKYGPKGRLAPVEVTVEQSGGNVVLKLPAAEGREGGSRNLELTLQKDGKHLLGTVQVHAGARGGSYRSAKFERADEAR